MLGDLCERGMCAEGILHHFGYLFQVLRYIPKFNKVVCTNFCSKQIWLLGKFAMLFAMFLVLSEKFKCFEQQSEINFIAELKRCLCCVVANFY